MTTAPAPKTMLKRHYGNARVARLRDATAYLQPYQRRELLRGIFGPDDWITKAARSLGVTPSHVKKLASGRRALTFRHWYILEAASSRRLAGCRKELERAQAAIAGRYREHEGRFRSAEQTIRMVLLRLRL